MSINCVCIILNVEFRFVDRKPREREFEESKKTDPDIIVSFNVTDFQGTQGSRVLSRSIIKLFDVCEFCSAVGGWETVSKPAYSMRVYTATAGT